jgi:hypothetical protein
MLDAIEISYMIIGSQATLLHGEPRLTQDIDVTLGSGPDRLPHLLSILRRESWKVLVDDPEQFVGDTMVLPCLDTESQIRVDCIFSFSTYEAEAIARAVPVELNGTTINYASAEDLIIHKIVAGRPRDLEDVRGVLLKNPDVGLSYIEDWPAQFDASLGEAFSRRFRDLRDAMN